MLLNIALALTAFVKDVLLASFLGTSSAADAITLAYFIPDTVGNNIFAFALGIACIPLFSSIIVKEGESLLSNALVYLVQLITMICIPLCLILFFFRVPIIESLASGFTNSNILVTSKLIIIILPIVLIMPLFVIASSCLQVLKKFYIASSAPVIFNAILLLVILMCIILKIKILNGVYIYSFGISFATLCIFIFVWKYLFKTKILSYNDFSFQHFKENSSVFLKPVLGILVPYIFILILTQSIYAVERAIASTLGTGNVASINYAFRLSQLPIWVFIAAIGTVSFPNMSQYAEAGAIKNLIGELNNSLKQIFIISIPISIILFIFRKEIITLLFMRGAFNKESVALTGSILAGYALAIPFQAFTYICIRFFISTRNLFPTILIISASTVVNIALDFILSAKFGFSGISYAALFGSIISFTGFLILLKKKMEVITV